jgi:hypothetical protein
MRVRRTGATGGRLAGSGGGSGFGSPSSDSTETCPSLERFFWLRDNVG